MQRRERHQAGSIYEASGSFYVRFRVTEDGQRKQQSARLCEKDKLHYSVACKPVKILRDAFMTKINARSGAVDDPTVLSYWTNIYLPFAEKNLRHSTLQGYKQIWSQHLEPHFGDVKMRAYTTGMASRFLTALADKYGRRTLNHIRSTASAIFTHALNLEYVGANPWHGAKALGKVREPNGTAHYTLEEVENIINALVDRPDLQLLVALAFFMGLRPSEVIALQWTDIDDKLIHIRRACVKGVVGPPKTPESAASLPIIEPIGLLLKLWRAKCPESPAGWVFPNSLGDKPHELRDYYRRDIQPILAAKKIPWKALYPGRRGAGTLLVELTGNLVAAQELLRHKSLTTTAMFYKKQTQSALSNGMKLLEAVAQK